MHSNSLPRMFQDIRSLFSLGLFQGRPSKPVDLAFRRRIFRRISIQEILEGVSERTFKIVHNTEGLKKLEVQCWVCSSCDLHESVFLGFSDGQSPRAHRFQAPGDTCINVYGF